MGILRNSAQEKRLSKNLFVKMKMTKDYNNEILGESLSTLALRYTSFNYKLYKTTIFLNWYLLFGKQELTRRHGVKQTVKQSVNSRLKATKIIGQRKGQKTKGQKNHAIYHAIMQKIMQTN